MVLSWEDICKESIDTLIVGNGASIALHQGFGYTNLYGKADELGIIDQDLKKVFTHFQTKDFELILKILGQTSAVNRILTLDNSVVEKSYKQVKSGLIKTIKNVHPRQSGELPRHLEAYGIFLSKFNFVISLNYDLLLYWATQKINQQDQHKFRDCFLNGSFDSKWRNSPYKVSRSTQRSSYVFYPHGNLFLATKSEGAAEIERKLNAGNSDFLLDVIDREWSTAGGSPLFVSEGNTTKKMRSIGKSAYLSHVYHDVLPTVGTKICVYGWSMDEQDEHILQAILLLDVQVVYVSIHIPGIKDLPDHLSKITGKIRKYSVNAAVKFFDSETVPFVLSKKRSSAA